MNRFTFAVIAVLTLVGSCAAANIQKKDVDIKASDGANLKGSYFSPGKNGPAILLLHQCNMDRHAWDGLANELANAGFHVLTFDFRGFGDSDGKTSDQAERQSMMKQKWPSDIDAAYAYLLKQKGVDKSYVAAGGASCGVAQSADFAARHHEIRALIELSGMASDNAKTYIAQTQTLPIFGAASDGDTAAAKGIQDLLATSKNPQSQLHIYQGTAHGAPMFEQSPELEPALVSWLTAQEKSKGSRPSAPARPTSW